MMRAQRTLATAVEFSGRGLHSGENVHVRVLPAGEDTGVEFLRRFVQHVLPRGFAKIRHYGLYASGNVPTKLVHARSLLASPPSSDVNATAQPQVIGSEPTLEQVTGRDPSRCPRCGSIAWHSSPLPQRRSPPAVTAIAA